MKNNRGAISVLLCGIFLAIIVLVGAATDAGSLAVAGSCAKRINYLACQSVLAEYDKNLFDDYGLMAFNGGRDKIESRIEEYIDRMTGADKKNPSSTVFFDLEAEGVEVDCKNNSLASSKIFIEKVREHLRNKSVEIGASVVSSWISGSGSGVSSKASSARSGLAKEEAEYRKAKEKEAAAREAGEEVEEVKKRESVNLNNNSFNVDDGPSDRILRSERVIAVLPSGSEYSGSSERMSYSLGKESQLLTLGEKSGAVLDSFNSAFSSGTDKLALIAYDSLYFKNALNCGDDMGDTFFSNELEYVIKGSLSDKSNYKSVKNQLFLLRTALNISHIYADKEKNSITLEAASFAGPYAAAVQFIFVTAWAAVEAREDLNCLYSGGRVPFVKASSDWKTGFSSIYSSASSASGAVTVKGKTTGSEEGRGLNYEGYLKLLMLTLGTEALASRTMDLIQTNMKGRYDIQFDLRNCIVKYSETAQFNRKPYLPSVLPGIIEDNALKVEGEYAY